MLATTACSSRRDRKHSVTYYCWLATGRDIKRWVEVHPMLLHALNMYSSADQYHLQLLHSRQCSATGQLHFSVKQPTNIQSTWVLGSGVQLSILFLRRRASRTAVAAGVGGYMAYTHPSAQQQLQSRNEL